MPMPRSLVEAEFVVLLLIAFPISAALDSVLVIAFAIDNDSPDGADPTTPLTPPVAELDGEMIFAVPVEDVDAAGANPVG